jgi:hypothetical protein
VNHQFGIHRDGGPEAGDLECRDELGGGRSWSAPFGPARAAGSGATVGRRCLDQRVRFQRGLEQRCAEGTLKTRRCRSFGARSSVAVWRVFEPIRTVTLARSRRGRVIGDLEQTPVLLGMRNAGGIDDGQVGNRLAVSVPPRRSPVIRSSAGG